MTRRPLTAAAVTLATLACAAPAQAHPTLSETAERGVAVNRTNAALDAWGRRIDNAGTGEFDRTHRALSRGRASRCKEAGHSKLGGHRWNCDGRFVWGVNNESHLALKAGLPSLAPCFVNYNLTPPRVTIGLFRTVTVTIHVIVTKRLSPVWRC